MKLLSLKLNSPYRSRQAGFEIEFAQPANGNSLLEFSPYCLVGRNGSGKSNVLEILAAIFYHLEATYLETVPDIFRKTENNPTGYFDSTQSYPNEFELEYITALVTNESMMRSEFQSLDYAPHTEFWAHVRIEKHSDTRPIVSVRNIPTDDSKANQWHIIDDRTMVRDLLPSYVVGYSSSENETLSIPYHKMRMLNYDEYCSKYIQNIPYQAPEGRLLYVDAAYSQAILLALFLMSDDEPAILKLFTDEIGIQHITEFRIKVNTDAAGINKAELDENKQYFALANGLIGAGGILDKLQKIATTSAKISNIATDSDEEGKYLMLDYCVDSETKRGFKEHFGTAWNLFQSLHVLQLLNLAIVDDFDYLVSAEQSTRSRIYQASMQADTDNDSLFIKDMLPVAPAYERFFNIENLKFSKKGIDKPIKIKELSDGEHQLLHTLGVCVLLRNENALFLLDEPETHFNPDWRANFIKMLRTVLDKNVLRDVLITTHSPYVVSDCHREQVLWFSGNTVQRPPFETFGTAITSLTAELFGRADIIGEYAKADLQNLANKLREWQAKPENEKTDEILNGVEAQLHKMGDSPDKTQLLFFIQRAKKS